MTEDSSKARSSRPLRLAALLAPALLVSSCGSIGEPMPPSLQIPLAVSDLVVAEQASDLIVTFTAPAMSTDGATLKTYRSVELRAGENRQNWDAASMPIEAKVERPGPVKVTTPVAPWVGRDLVFRVRIAGSHGRFSEWSNAVRMKVLEPLATPAVQAGSAPRGVRLTWEPQEGAQYRISKQGPGEQSPALAATVKTPEFDDDRAEFGQAYRYTVQAFVKTGDSEARSEASEPASITPEDRFAPAVPQDVTATASISSIELSWTPDTEPDLRGYYVYRAREGGAFERAGDLLPTPAYSDRAIESGKKYRYEVSAVDQRGNESARSAAVEATAP